MLEGDCHTYFLSDSLSSIFLIGSDGTNERLIRDRVLGCDEDALDEASCVAAGFSWFVASTYEKWCNGDTFSHFSVEPAWHPDGESIAYLNFAPSYHDFGFDSIPKCFVMLMDLQGNDLELLLNPADCLTIASPAWSSTGILGYGLAWSPDGNSTAYENAESVIVIDFIDGTEEDIFITGVQGFQPNWSLN